MSKVCLLMMKQSWWSAFFDRCCFKERWRENCEIGERTSKTERKDGTRQHKFQRLWGEVEMLAGFEKEGKENEATVRSNRIEVIVLHWWQLKLCDLFWNIFLLLNKLAFILLSSHYTCSTSLRSYPTEWRFCRIVDWKWFSMYVSEKWIEVIVILFELIEPSYYHLALRTTSPVW